MYRSPSRRATSGSRYVISSITWHQWHQTATRSSSTSFFSAFARSKTLSDHGCQSIAGACSAANVREMAQAARSGRINLERMVHSVSAHENRARLFAHRRRNWMHETVGGHRCAVRQNSAEKETQYVRMKTRGLRRGRQNGA